MGYAGHIFIGVTRAWVICPPFCKGNPEKPNWFQKF